MAMLRLGLTGGIGAGKSTVSAVFEATGAVIVDADRIAREVVAPGTPGLAMIVAEFGEQVLDDRGELDRATLAALAFSDPGRTAALNAITHPLIGERTDEIFAAAPPDAITVHDVPLLVESGLAPAYHLVVVVDTPESVRLERLVGQRGMPEEDARARMERQATDAQRRQVADVLVDNSGPHSGAEVAVRQLLDDRLRPFEHNLRTGTPVTGLREVVPHRGDWAAEAERASARLRWILGDTASRVDHVGPTAVPGLDAPDIVDLQVSVRDAEARDRAVQLLREAGYVRDTSTTEAVLHWCDPARPLEITVRGEDDPEQEFALLMAEVLEDPTARSEYSRILDAADREETRAWERARCRSTGR